MNEYEEKMKLKREDVYKHLRELWFTVGNTAFDGLHDLLDTIYFSESFLSNVQDNPKLMSTVTKLLSLKATTNIRINELYPLIKDDQLYSALTHAKMDHGYFAIAIYLYVWNHGGFDDKYLSVSTDKWDKVPLSESGQDVFNQMIRQVQWRLDIFYT